MIKLSMLLLSTISRMADSRSEISSMILAQRVMVLKRFADRENISSWKECLDAWSMLNQSSVLLHEDVVHQVHSIFQKHLFSKGIIMIGDLLFDAGIFLKGVKVLNANLSHMEHFSSMGIVDAIPLERAAPSFLY